MYLIYLTVSIQRATRIEVDEWGIPGRTPAYIRGERCEKKKVDVAMLLSNGETRLLDYVSSNWIKLVN